MITQDDLYVPPDTYQAYLDWGATCGPAALAAILACRVMSLKKVMQPYRGYTTFGAMRLALKKLDVPYHVLRNDFKLTLGFAGVSYAGRLSMIQWGGSWLQPGVHVGAALSRTHWVAVVEDPVRIYDVNAGSAGTGCWVTLQDWMTVIAPSIMETIRGCDGTWSARSTIMIGRQSSELDAADAVTVHRPKADLI